MEIQGKFISYSSSNLLSFTSESFSHFELLTYYHFHQNDIWRNRPQTYFKHKWNISKQVFWHLPFYPIHIDQLFESRGIFPTPWTSISEWHFNFLGSFRAQSEVQLIIGPIRLKKIIELTTKSASLQFARISWKSPRISIIHPIIYINQK